jgi:diadenosine tetraphosphate (Ap4A) HIT family hydrolase
MSLKDENCLFCSIDKDRVIDENDFAYVIRDGFSVTEHHSLIIPKRHVEDYFGLNADELEAINALLKSTKKGIDMTDPSVDGYNIGMNCGESAGQTIFHCHVHLIPRRKGDVENPRGGVRHLIPGKGYY